MLWRYTKSCQNSGQSYAPFLGALHTRGLIIPGILTATRLVRLAIGIYSSCQGWRRRPGAEDKGNQGLELRKALPLLHGRNISCTGRSLMRSLACCILHAALCILHTMAGCRVHCEHQDRDRRHAKLVKLKPFEDCPKNSESRRLPREQRWPVAEMLASVQRQ